MVIGNDLVLRHGVPESIHARATGTREPRNFRVMRLSTLLIRMCQTGKERVVVTVLVNQR